MAPQLNNGQSADGHAETADVGALVSRTQDTVFTGALAVGAVLYPV